jgi:glycosyltransferase involved in cell wall biosynthesis
MGPTRKIRIMRIIARMNVGGPAIQITGIEKNLNSGIFDHLLITGNCDSSEIDYLIENEINLELKRVIGLGKKVNILSDIQALISIRKLIKDFRPDIVHTHTAKAGFLGRIAVLLSGLKIRSVHTYHGHLLHGYFNSILTGLIIRTEKLLALKTNILVAVGSKVRDELLFSGIGSIDQYRIVNPGLSISPLPKRQSVNDRFGLDQNFRYISWLGRLVKIKRPDRLLEIAYWLKVNYPDVRILVAGDGPLREEIEKKATQSHLPIQFLGWVLDIESVLAVSEIMILTSDNEGTPLSLIQAQMAGLPVVATDVGSTSEIVINNETGLIVPTSVELINKAIGALLQDQQKARLMGQRARIRALELYSIERLVRDHEKIYLELMSSV